MFFCIGAGRHRARGSPVGTEPNAALALLVCCLMGIAGLLWVFM